MTGRRDHLLLWLWKRSGLGVAWGRNPNWKREGWARWQVHDNQTEFDFGGRLWLMGGWSQSSKPSSRDLGFRLVGREWELVCAEDPWILGDLPTHLVLGTRWG